MVMKALAVSSIKCLDAAESGGALPYKTDEKPVREVGRYGAKNQAG